MMDIDYEEVNLTYMFTVFFTYR